VDTDCHCTLAAAAAASVEPTPLVALDLKIIDNFLFSNNPKQEIVDARHELVIDSG
jgi:hypothetical protein